MEPLNILLIVLVIVAIWAVVELALTIKHARGAVDDIARSANETIEQVQPIIAKVDGMADDLDPAIKDVPSLVEKAGVTLDGANATLDSVNGILGDVSSVSGAVSGVTDQVGRAASSAVGGLVSRLTGGRSDAKAELSESDDAQAPQDEAPEKPQEPESGRGYVTYGAVTPDAE